jgi:serine/threonine-protein kinase
MVDDPPNKDDTVRQQATIRGVAKIVDAGSAETALAPPIGAPPPNPAPALATVRVGGPIGGGALLPERYKLGQVLGQGGMGEVLLAMDEHIGREVAVKRIRTHRPSAEEISRFVREARIQGRLEHPAIVPVHDVLYDGDGKPSFVMKRLSGTDMHEVLRSCVAARSPRASAPQAAARSPRCASRSFAHARGSSATT